MPWFLWVRSPGLSQLVTHQPRILVLARSAISPGIGSSSKLIKALGRFEYFEVIELCCNSLAGCQSGSVFSYQKLSQIPVLPSALQHSSLCLKGQQEIVTVTANLITFPTSTPLDTFVKGSSDQVKLMRLIWGFCNKEVK